MAAYTNKALPFHEPKLLIGCSVVALLIVIPVAWRIIYSLFFHPLRRFPGPWYTACSSLPLGIAGLSPSEPTWLFSLVEKYGKNGSPIRIAPDMLLFHKANQLRDIYVDSASNTKGGIYQHEALGPVSVFTTIGAEDHRKLRKALGGAFWSLGNMRKEWEPKIDQLILQWVENQRRHARNGESVILSNKTSEFAFDVLTMVVFTNPWGFIKNDRDERGMIHAWREGTMLFGLAHRWRFMRKVILGSRLLRRVILPKVSDDWGTGWLMTQGAREISDRKQVLSQEPPPSKPFKDALQHTIDARIDGEPLDDVQKLAHMTLLLQAGADTTGTGLGSTLNLILSHPRVLAKVREELASAEARGLLSQPVVQYDETKSHLPYTSACIRETLRMEPPLPNLFSRLAPAPTGRVVGDVPVPAGTQMLSHPFVVQRDAEVFGPAPDEFRPERWLESEERTVRMDASLFTFGMGPRNCIGRELALMELHKLVPEALRRFDMGVLDEGRYRSCGGVAYMSPGLHVTLTARD